jgi:hypothetical protein
MKRDMKRDMTRLQEESMKALTTPGSGRITTKCFLVLENQLYSVSDLEEITISDRRTVQFWIEAGVLTPTHDTNRQGRGVHRSFDASEVAIACMLRGVAQNRWPIGRLIGIAAVIRGEFVSDIEKTNHINSAIAGKSNLFLVVEPGLKLVLLADPTPEEALAHTFGEMIGCNSRDTSSKTIIHLTPWLSRARETLPQR